MGNQQHQYNIYMQKEKKQSQLLPTLSEILKLYHKYLLCSLRQDLIIDRKNGMLENIRDRIKVIIEKCALYDRQATPSVDQQIGQPDDPNKQKYDNKLVSRFLARLSEKVKGYMDQFTKDQLPEFLTQSMAAIQKTSHHFRLSELLTSLFGLTNSQYPTKTKKEDRRNSSLYNLVQFPEKRTAKSSTVAQVLIPQKIIKAEQSKTNFLSAYTKKSNLIQQLIELINIVELDQKDLRRKYFAVQQVITQHQSQSQNNLRPLHTHYDQSMPTYSNFSISNTTNPFTPKQHQNQSSLALSTNANLIITNSTQYTNYQSLNNNQVYIEMLDRNKNIGHMIKRYETCYEKYRKRQISKIEKSKQRQKDKQRMKERLSMPSIHVFEPHTDDIKVRPDQQLDTSRNLSPQNCSPEKNSQKLIKKISSRQIQDQIERQLYRQIYNQTSNQKQRQRSGQNQSNGRNHQIQPLNTKTENSSFPELRTVKFEYNAEPTNQNIYHMNTKNSILSKKAEKLLKIIKPTLNPQLSQTKNQRKQKSISTSALSVLNPISAHLKNMNTYTQAEININLQLNSRQYQPPINDINSNGNNQSELVLSTSTYNNLNSIVRSKQLLNKLLNKVAGTGTMGEMQGSIICLNKLQADGHADKGKGESDEMGIAYGDHNWKQSHVHSSHDNHINTLQRSTKKPLLYRQQLMERRAKAQAMYNKSRPSQIGSLRSNISFPKMQEFEAPSFLMACRSYQKAADSNSKNSKNNTTHINKNLH